MNLSIETLVTVIIAVLVAGIVGTAVFGESTDFINWSSEETDTARCDLAETQAGLACPDQDEVENDYINNAEDYEHCDFFDNYNICEDFCSVQDCEQ